MDFDLSENNLNNIISQSIQNILHQSNINNRDVIQSLSSIASLYNDVTEDSCGNNVQLSYVVYVNPVQEQEEKQEISQSQLRNAPYDSIRRNLYNSFTNQDSSGVFRVNRDYLNNQDSSSFFNSNRDHSGNTFVFGRDYSGNPFIFNNKVDSSNNPIVCNKDHSGWPLHLFESVPQDVICTLCECICCEVVTINCGHSFCQMCIMSSSFNFRNKCPSCEDKITQMVPDFAKRMRINGLTTFCAFKDNGCTHKSALRSIATHESVCTYKPFPCHNCLQPINHQNHRNHSTNDCNHRLVQCELCKDDIPFLYMNEHSTASCPNLLKQCSYCLWYGTVGTYQDHITICNSYPVSCSYAYFGCTSILPRSEMITHIYRDNHVHVVSEYIKKHPRILPDGPFSVHNHLSKLFLYANEKGDCSHCMKPIEEEDGRYYAYRSQYNSSFRLCPPCLVSQRIYR